MNWAFGCQTAVSVPGNLFFFFNFTFMHFTAHSSLSYPPTPLFFLFTFVGRGCLYWFFAQVVCNGDCAGLGLIQPQLSAVLCDQPSLWSTCFFQQHQSMLRDVPMKALPHWLTHGFEELQSCVAASSSISALLIWVMQKKKKLPAWSPPSAHLQLEKVRWGHRLQSVVCQSVCMFFFECVFTRLCFVVSCPHFVKAFQM